MSKNNGVTLIALSVTIVILIILALYDETLENGDKWNIIINNSTFKQYGTGYNYIKKGTEIYNYGKTKYDWIVNYNNGEIIQMDTDYALWLNRC